MKLYKAIMKTIGSYKKLYMKKYSEKELCEKLNVQTLSYENLEDIERLLNITIYLSGDVSYKTMNKNRSRRKTPIMLELIDGEYQPLYYNFEEFKQRRKQLLFNYDTFDKKVGMICIKRLDKMYEVYDGNTTKTCTYRELKKLKSKHVSKFCNDKETNLEEEYNEWMSLINEYKGTNIKWRRSADPGMHAINYFVNNSYGSKPAHEIDHEEAQMYLHNNGGIMGCINGTYIDVYYYDVNSRYASIMASGRSFPISKGDIKHYTWDEFVKLEFFRYGIYNVQLDFSKYKQKIKILRANRDNMYTHVDLKIAKEEGIIFIKQDTITCMIYESWNRETGTHMFKNTIDYLYMLKKQGLKDSKKILTLFWGSLTAPYKIYQKKLDIFNASETALPENSEIVTMTPHNLENNMYIVKYRLKHESYFKTNYARIGKFLTSFAREEMYKIIKDNRSEVIRVHTDGLYITKKLKLKISEYYGDWKEEHYNKVIINNLNNVERY